MKQSCMMKDAINAVNDGKTYPAYASVVEELEAHGYIVETTVEKKPRIVKIYGK